MEEMKQWQQIDPVQKADIEAHFEKILTRLTELRDHVSNYSFAIPQHYFANFRNTLSQMNDEVLDNKTRALPKKKFAFVRKGNKAKKNTAPANNEEEKKQESTTTSQSILNNSLGNHLLIKDQYHTEIRKTAQEYEGKENVIVEGLENVTLYLPFGIKCLYVKNVVDCIIYVGAVSGASFINEAKNCRIYLRSHQIRIHHSHKVDFYLVARSNPIIEHCDELKFGVYNCQYENSDNDAEQTQLKDVKNMYD